MVLDIIFKNRVYDSFYRKENRFYHTEEHIENSLSVLERYLGAWENRDEKIDDLTLKYAILFHDSNYSPGGLSNEDFSADNAKNWLFDYQKVADVQRLILVTKYNLPKNKDEEMMVNIDFSILGSNWLKYKQYAENIRKEYQPYVGDDSFRRGRIKLLRDLLDRDTVFTLYWFMRQYEEQAVSNISRELLILLSSLKEKT